MKVNIFSNNIPVTDSLREHVEHCSEKLKKFDSTENMVIKVTLSKYGKHQFSADVSSTGGKYFTASKLKGFNSHSDDMYLAITSAFDSIEHTMSTEKSKILSKRFDNNIRDYTDSDE